MADKPLILLYGDAPVVHTGFGIVNYEIFSRLKDKYDLRILGINFDGEDPIPGARDFVLHGCNRQDPRGIGKFPALLEGYKPDLVFITNDYDAAEHVVQPLVRARQIFDKRIPLIHYFPVDGEPVYQRYIDYFKTFVDQPVVVTKHGQKAILNTDPHFEVPYVYHGVDTKHYKPLDKKVIEQDKADAKLDGKFTVLMVGVNQIRKQYNIAIEAFAEFAADKEDVGLHLHTAKNTNYGWDLMRIVTHESDKNEANGKLPIADRVGFTNGINGPMGLHRDLMPRIYNMADVFVNCSLGEGFGLPVIEAMACGKPVIYHNVTAMPEIVGDTGIPIETKMTYKFPFGDRSLERPIPDKDSLVEALNKSYDDRNMLAELGNKARERVLNEPEFNWDNIAHKMSKIIDETLEEKRILDISDEEIL